MRRAANPLARRPKPYLDKMRAIVRWVHLLKREQAISGRFMNPQEVADLVHVLVGDPHWEVTDSD